MLIPQFVLPERQDFEQFVKFDLQSQRLYLQDFPVQTESSEMQNLFFQLRYWRYFAFWQLHFQRFPVFLLKVLVWKQQAYQKIQLLFLSLAEPEQTVELIDLAKVNQLLKSEDLAVKSPLQ